MIEQTFIPKVGGKNRKLGDLLSTYRSVTRNLDENNQPLDGTCPALCPFLKKCYANFSHVGIWQNKAKSTTANLFEWIVNLPANQKVRHLVSGDFYRPDGSIDGYLQEMNDGAKARPDTKHFAYTHGWRYRDKSGHLRYRKASVFNKVSNAVTNASTESPEQVRIAMKLGYACVMVVPEDTPDKVDFGDFKGIVCLEQSKGVKCADCMLCAKGNRKSVIMFRSHGSNKKTIERLIA